MIRTRAAALFAAVFTLAGCSDSPTEENTDPAGRTSFQYSSSAPAFNGTFSAEGVAPPGVILAQDTGAPYAHGRPDEVGFTIVGSLPRTSGHHVLFVLTPAPAERTYPLDPACTDIATCAVVIFGAPFPSGGTLVNHRCSLLTGSIKLARVGRQRIKGEFSGSGSCEVLGTEGQTPITISGGTFDVPLNLPVSANGAG